MTRDVITQTRTQKVEEMVSRIGVKMDLAVKELLSYPQMSAETLERSTSRTRVVQAAIQAAKEYLSPEGRAPSTQKSDTPASENESSLDSALSSAAVNLLALSAELWKQVEDEQLPKRKAKN